MMVHLDFAVSDIDVAVAYVISCGARLQKFNIWRMQGSASIRPDIPSAFVNMFKAKTELLPWI